MTIALPQSLREQPSAPVGGLSIESLPRGVIDALYVHIPFCFHKCHYCDFYSITRQTPERMRRFVDLILVEANLWTGVHAPQVKPRTIFFGGGTPTLLPIDEMRRLIDGLRERFDFSDLREFTTEANPATVDLERCQMLREVGVDRISFGAQSFDRTELATLERHHDPDDVPRSVDLARQAGLQRINIDLIYAIPGQTMESWSRSLNAALALKLNHFSCYGLTYESNTPIAVKKRLGRMIPTADEIELEMMHSTRRRLGGAGLPPYEISNYAAAGEECLHNLHYWTGGSYVGLGPSAASHVNGVRFRNRPHLSEWERAIELGELPASDIEHLSPRQRAGELAMLMLRLTDGIDYVAFAERTEYDARDLFGETISTLRDQGLLEQHPNRARLTELGRNVADAIAAEFLA